MFPAATVSDFVFGSLIWKALRALVFSQTGRCRAPRGCLSREKCYSAGVVGLQFDWLVAGLEALRVSAFTRLPAKEKFISARGWLCNTEDFAALWRIVLFNNCFLNFDEITKNSVYSVQY